MNATHPSEATNLHESATTTISASTTIYSDDLYYFVGKYQEFYPSYGARVLAQNIADFYRPNVGYAFVTQALLAEIMNISTQQVRVLLKEVEASGYWEIQRGASARNEATRYRPVASELDRAARWKAAKFDSKVSFTDPKVRAKSTKVSTRAPQGFTKDRAKKAESATVETEYVFTEGVVPDWGQADPTETAPEPDVVTESTETVPADMDPFGNLIPTSTVQSTAAAPEQSDSQSTTHDEALDLDPFGNPFPAYTAQPTTTHL